MWSTRRLIDKGEILSYLRGDEEYGAYAIGDLEREMFALCTFAGATLNGQLHSLVLHFRGLDVPALLLMGRADGVGAILAREFCPNRVYLTLREEHCGMARGFYHWAEMVPMWRMALRPRSFRAPDGTCIRLGPHHVPQLLELYSLGGADAFSPSQVGRGIFYGAMDGSSLIAAAGTHLVSPTYGVAAVGNVFVHPDYRRLGLGSLVTGAVVTELLRRAMRMIILNVAQANDSAVEMYRKLGFERSCPFYECPVATAIG
jgi:GNAT superfamily N-acetyltransferase